jgi:hypothetical protein
LTRRNPLFKIGRTPLFKIGRNPLFKTAVVRLLSRGSGRHGKGNNPVNGYNLSGHRCVILSLWVAATASLEYNLPFVS